MNNKHAVKKTNLTVEKKYLALVLPYPKSKTLKTRTKLKKSLKTSIVAVNC